MSTSTFDTAINQARDLLRWRSPLRTELWAARLTASLRPEEREPFLRRLVSDQSDEARLILAALAAVTPEGLDALTGENDVPADDLDTPSGGNNAPASGLDTPAGGNDVPTPAGEGAGAGAADAGVFGRAAREAVRASREWVARMGRVSCEGAWYGKADPYGEQVLAALAFRYGNGKEPHVVVVAIDQVNGGLAVDALVEEVKFLDDLDLEVAEPGVVAGRVLDAFEVTDLVMGAPVAETLAGVRGVAVCRARVANPVRHSPDDTVARFKDLPELPGAEEAFEKLAEFVGDRPLWWSPARVSQFLTSWLPREAILSDAAIEAMPEVLRAWSRFVGAQDEVLRRVEEDTPRLPALMADDSLAGLGKRIAQNRRH
ncbi:hypothetical protein ABT294_42855 [Nonomuraea sp. NPDC000554]|uniref:hypothetical protein n=1 Tax=Nonomuraea sp. NPDC000554 TaxID=3154259 RepID=UPI00331DE286